ncbi:MAG TPA: chemotaxis-specific protein-glutamate methyltransferase CheB [Kofleriaceae bacterium]|nr:chemotaxis-specific protein-glutamate methyltransferase CheB [Kofleriaceae bacterium]
MKIGIANDSPLAVEALRRVLQGAGHSVVWVATDGREAVAQCKIVRPDILLLDLRMPVMDGVECTRRIMAEAPCAILLVTATVSGNYTQVYDAMGAGALDAVNTPQLGSGGDLGGGKPLLDKIDVIAKLVAPRPIGSKRISQPIPVVDDAPSLVAIGASTGGPDALARVLGDLRSHDEAAVVIVQHVDAEFAGGLAEWLASRSGFKTALIGEGDTPRAGVALIAATNDHLVMRPGRVLGYQIQPRRVPYRPSVDVFFRSLASAWPRRAIAVLLTGMGEDGAEGLRDLRQLGWNTIAQDESSSVVYGMPRAAAELGAATHVLALPDIGPRIIAGLRAARR